MTGLPLLLGEIRCTQHEGWKDSRVVLCREMNEKSPWTTVVIVVTVTFGTLVPPSETCLLSYPGTRIPRVLPHMTIRCPQITTLLRAYPTVESDRKLQC